ncbi:hypothetical protein FVEN_g3628 [Fusarium venenatum]|nr:hypothetical protein FVEN_g3628 [Fusarium venenatum]
MDESLILALSLAEAVEADAALIEEFMQEDQIARDRMIAEALNEDRQATIEPVSHQPVLDGETYNTLRRFNIVPSETDAANVEDEEAQNLVTDAAQDDQSVQRIQVAAGNQEAGDNQDAGNNQDTVDNQDTFHNEDTVDCQNIVCGQLTPEMEDGDAPNTNTLEEHPQHSTTTDGPANDQQTEDDQVQVETQEQARNNTDVLLATVETSPAPAPSSEMVPIPDMKQCLSCQDDFSDAHTFQAPCSHHWCQPCLVLCIESSLKDESLFPPKCCEPLPVESCYSIPQDLVKRFQDKTLEFSTVDRTYCSDAACATFIFPQSIKGGIRNCTRCERQTCILCKQVRHEGICSEDTEAQEVLHLGQQQGWQRCEKCKHLIDLKIGCYHISCPCGHQFCYICGARWKTCQCPHWNENRLVDAAPGRVALAMIRIRDAYQERQAEEERQHRERERQERERQAEAIRRERAEQIRREVQERTSLHPDYCFHQSYVRVEGRHECAERRQTPGSFILECDDCDIYVCHRCRDAGGSWQFE